MEEYIKITNLNDFIFCPLSIYYHELYGQIEPLLYYDKPQLDGKAAHDAIDNAMYSTHKNVLQGVDVFSEKYNLCGKIDIFDIDTGVLTERKKKITKIYDGYIFQLYAQFYCLTEMGYEVKKIRFHSKDDNKLYYIDLPSENIDLDEKFMDVLRKIRDFDPLNYAQDNADKCKHCIYSDFCSRSKDDKYKRL